MPACILGPNLHSAMILFRLIHYEGIEVVRRFCLNMQWLPLTTQHPMECSATLTQYIFTKQSRNRCIITTSLQRGSLGRRGKIIWWADGLEWRKKNGMNIISWCSNSAPPSIFIALLPTPATTEKQTRRGEKTVMGYFSPVTVGWFTIGLLSFVKHGTHQHPEQHITVKTCPPILALFWK